MTVNAVIVLLLSLAYFSALMLIVSLFSLSSLTTSLSPLIDDGVKDLE